MTTSTEYINPSVNPAELGILAIGLGGSRAHSPQSESDWDGFGILSTKEDVLNLVTKGRKKLCELLWIEVEECPSWTVGIQSEWDVLRFSGKDKDGTKRTIKFWTVESLRSACSNALLCRLGVMSYRAVGTFHHKGPVLYVAQPKRVSEHLYVLEDADFLVHKNLLLTAVVPGVTCDLLLTSVPVFDATKLDLFKSAMVSKWSKLFGVTGAEDMADSFHSSKTFPTIYRQHLEKEIARMRERTTDHETLGVSGNILALKPLVTTSIFNEPAIGQNRYQLTCFIGDLNTKSPSYYPSIPEKTHQQPIAVDESVLKACAKEYICSPFSSNSMGFCTRAMDTSNKLVDIFVKTGPGVPAEVDVLSMLQAHFPQGMLQNVLAFDPLKNRMVCEKYPGTTLSDIRLSYYETMKDAECDKVAFHWLVNIELARAQQVTTVQLNTIRSRATSDEKQMIHRFYHGRLHLDRRAAEFYGEESPEFFQTEQNKRLALKEFMLLPLVINGQRLGSLDQCCRQAEGILDPTGPCLSNSSVAVGLGDGHGGNVMAMHERVVALRFVDYEVSGWHNPLLDMAKPLYNDALFSVLYRELLSAGGSNVDHKVTDEAIIVNFNNQFSLLDRTLAYIKLEYMLRPLLERLAAEFPNDSKFAEGILGGGLFTCAFLARNFSSHQDAFFLNVAVGVLLLTDVKGTLNRFFGWSNWPSMVKLVDDPPVFSEAENNSSRALTKTDASDDRVHSQQVLQQLVDFISTFGNPVPGLEPEMVCLKRVADTLQLHEGFSSNRNEDSGNVIARIGRVRKLAMKIAPHTCIRESMFAEPRIDHHFKYENVITEGRGSGSIKLVDVGCCMGSDLRKLIVDGFTAKNILGLDYEKRFFPLGKMLYNEDSSAFEFRYADVLAEKFSSDNADLNSRFDFVHSANVIHLYSPEQQVLFFKVLAFMVKPGGLIWGRQVGLSEGDLVDEHRRPSGKGARFTAAEFKTLILRATGWAEDDVVYEHQTVQYEELRIARVDKQWVLQWSVRVPMDKEPKARLVEIL